MPSPSTEQKPSLEVEVERILAISDEQVLAEASKAVLAWAKGWKEGFAIGRKAVALTARPPLSDDLAGLVKRLHNQAESWIKEPDGSDIPEAILAREAADTITTFSRRAEAAEADAARAWKAHTLAFEQAIENGSAAQVAKRRVSELEAGLRELQAFVGVMFGQGSDAIFPETVTTLGVPIKLGAIMRNVSALLTEPRSVDEGKG